MVEFILLFLFFYFVFNSFSKRKARGTRTPRTLDAELKQLIQESNDADMDTLIVTAADKAHNARSIATDLQNQGASLWDRFNANQADIIWYYESVYAVLHQRQVSSTLLTPLRNAIDVMNGPTTA